MWKFYLHLPFLLFGISLAKSIPSILLPSQNGLDSQTPVCSLPDPKLNYKPIIGILTHPGDGAYDARHSLSVSYETNISYIAASYVKLAESGGARVIPLIYNEPEESLFQKLELVNAVIFTGGWDKTGPYYDTVEKIFKKVLEKNDAGEHFPVYAMCLGFEILSMIISQYGISPENFRANPALSSFFSILTTSNDKDRKTYVSTIRSKRYPVTAFQWHPEKNAFEWGSSEIPHSEDAIQVTQHAASYLVSEARKSPNKPSSDKMLENLIYNYKPTYSGYKGSGDDEVYIFT